MALQFTRESSTQNQTAPVTATPTVPAEDNFEVQEFDLMETKAAWNSQLVNSADVDRLVSTISLNDPQTIVEFGGEAAREIAKCSDMILRSVNMNQINDSGELLTHLSKIMDKFDLQEVVDDGRRSLIGKIFGKVKMQIDQLIAKYNTMADEVDKIYVKLKQYEVEIKESNKKLEKMFEANLDYYQELVKYILAGEQGIKEIEDYLVQMEEDFKRTGDTTIQFDITNLEQAKLMLEQRTHDLRIAENVAMQSIPMIKTMQFSNFNLIRKINSAFIITLPIFKQALTQAILLKRQKIQAQAMAALDEKTNEMLLKNAQNTVEQSKLTTQLASTSAVKIETLESTFNTIMNGIEETKRIQEEASSRRKDDVVRLQTMKDDFNKKFHMEQQR